MYNGNDLFVYFEVINNIAPNRVLDIGPYLKSIGGVSRQVDGKAIPNDIILDAVDTMESVPLEIYEIIYNEIYAINSMPKSKYNLSILLMDIRDNENYEEWVEKLICNSEYLLIKEEYIGNLFLENYKYKELSVDNDKYRIYFIE